MSIAEKIHSNLTLAILMIVVAVCGFLFAIMIWIYGERVSLIQQQYDNKISKLNSQPNSEINPGSKASEASTKPDKQSESASATSVVAAATPALQAPAKFEPIFSASSFYPLGYEHARIGLNLSVLQAMFPKGKGDANSFSIYPETGPFSSIVFFYEKVTDDPIVGSIAYYIRDDTSDARVRTEAAAAFSHIKMENLSGGALLRWKSKDIIATYQPNYYALDNYVDRPKAPIMLRGD